MSEELKDPRTFVSTYFESKGIIVDERGTLKTKSGKNNEEVFDTMYLDYISIVGHHNTEEKMKAPAFRKTVSPIPEKTLLKAMFELIANKKANHRIEVINSLKCTNPSMEIVTRFIKAVTGSEDASDVAVIAHWMWSVKRKMLNESVVYHIMPILFGKQEGGKSVALNRLIGPVNNFRLNISMNEMADSRYYKAMADSYCVVFDELQGASRTDVDSLKRQITTEENDYRPLGTNQVFKVKQNCSFIGATNRSVSEQIIDVTGMRRFYELHCQDKLDWDLLGSINYLEFWQSIDENKEEGYMLDQIDNVREKQKSLVAADEITTFMEDNSLIVGNGTCKKVPVSDLFDSYKSWAIDNGFQIKTINWFSRALSGKGFVKGKHRVGNKTVNYFSIPDVKVVVEAEVTPINIRRFARKQC